MRPYFVVANFLKHVVRTFIYRYKIAIKSHAHTFIGLNGGMNEPKSAKNWVNGLENLRIYSEKCDADFFCFVKNQ
jgi:hypothetical protein